MTSKIGIGTIRPQSPLSVSGGAAIGTNYAGNNAAPTNGLIVQDKVGIGTSSPKSPLSVSGGAAIGTSYAGSQAAPTNGLIVEGNVGIGTDDPQNPLSVSGGAAIGTGYAGSQAAPTNGLIVEGNVGIGTDDPQNPLSVTGDISLTGNMLFSTSNGQKLNLWGAYHGVGVQSATTYFRSTNHFAWYKSGSHAGGALDAGSGGTALMVLKNNGDLGLGTTSPGAKLDVHGNANVSGTLSVGSLSVTTPLILIKTFSNKGEDKFDTGVPTSDYAAACITGFRINADIDEYGHHNPLLLLRMITQNGTWFVNFRLAANDGPRWTFDVAFFHRNLGIQQG